MIGPTTSADAVTHLGERHLCWSRDVSALAMPKRGPSHRSRSRGPGPIHTWSVDYARFRLSAGVQLTILPLSTAETFLTMPPLVGDPFPLKHVKVGGHYHYSPEVYP